MTNPSADYGVHSEVGKLRKVLVCSPGLAHERLTPTNCDDLLFDDVLWVQNARRDHFDFMDKMRDRDVDVVELHHLLTETMAMPEAPLGSLSPLWTVFQQHTKFPSLSNTDTRFSHSSVTYTCPCASTTRPAGQIN